MKSKRRIAVFTGNRAEYGLLFPLLKLLRDHEGIDFHLIVSGAHLDKNFGKTLEMIRNDGFNVSSEVKIDMNMDSLSSTPKAIGSAILSMTQTLENIRPDIFVVYADRFEGFAAAIASTQMCIPTAHIEGGDITEGGAFDDSVRHAITKLAHLHFTTNQEAANRVVSMGEEIWRVHNVGFTGIDLIKDSYITSEQSLIDQYKIDVSKPLVLFTQHPVSIEYDDTKKNIEQSLRALWRLANEGVQIVITYPNNDVGCKIIIEQINYFINNRNNKNIYIYPSLGQKNYYGFLSLALDMNKKIVCCGNSSSGIKETPAFYCPTVNIGTRQNGRLRAENVLDVSYDENEIYSKIRYSLYDVDFRNKCREIINPYGQGDASEKILDVLMKIKLNNEILNKKMTLVNF
ncbi:UDP-N-acetylglucosamine 2-epimerase [Fluviispira vulneris]|uniref:UDP-N-acetylglucosamine 2-epimerase n=1 Tax=Fluviispira vulneris TaxID=2763012 RepID=UPI001646EF72|nr:UDP-N-acetylglucosamine 2-epimerase [Fluviispira vulneris]